MQNLWTSQYLKTLQTNVAQVKTLKMKIACHTHQRLQNKLILQTTPAMTMQPLLIKAMEMELPI